MKIIKFEHVSEVNILIEVLKHYKHCKAKQLNLDVDKMLDVCIELQKMFMSK